MDAIGTRPFLEESGVKSDQTANGYCATRSDTQLNQRQSYWSGDITSQGAATKAAVKRSAREAEPFTWREHPVRSNNIIANYKKNTDGAYHLHNRDDWKAAQRERRNAFNDPSWAEYFTQPRILEGTVHLITGDNSLFRVLTRNQAHWEVGILSFSGVAMPQMLASLQILESEHHLVTALSVESWPGVLQMIQKHIKGWKISLEAEMGFPLIEAYSLPTNAKSLAGSVMANLCGSHYPLNMMMVEVSSQWVAD